MKHVNLNPLTVKTNNTLISKSMIPSQRNTLQSLPYRYEFSPTDWLHQVNRDPELSWTKGNNDWGAPNYFARDELYKKLGTDITPKVLPNEPIYGLTRYLTNPLDQEQTCSHTTAFATEQATRIVGPKDGKTLIRTQNTIYPVRHPITVYEGQL